MLWVFWFIYMSGFPLLTDPSALGFIISPWSLLLMPSGNISFTDENVTQQDLGAFTAPEVLEGLNLSSVSDIEKVWLCYVLGSLSLSLLLSLSLSVSLSFSLLFFFFVEIWIMCHSQVTTEPQATYCAPYSNGPVHSLQLLITGALALWRWWSVALAQGSE